MLQQPIPTGPTKAPDTLPDRTMILDPKDYWPDPKKCPDWPCLRPDQVANGIIGKRGAEMQLEAIKQRLNRHGHKLRFPTPADRADEMGRVFRFSGFDWQHLGIPNLSAGPFSPEDANDIVEACLIRGFLRKLEVQEKEAAAAADRQRLSRARQTLDNYRTEAPERIEQMKTLSEAAARHQQRLDDQIAWNRLRDAKQNLDGLYSQAVKAAHELGLSVPDAPDVLSGEG